MDRRKQPALGLELEVGLSSDGGAANQLISAVGHASLFELLIGKVNYLYMRCMSPWAVLIQLARVSACLFVKALGL